MPCFLLTGTQGGGGKDELRYGEQQPLGVLNGFILLFTLL